MLLTKPPFDLRIMPQLGRLAKELVNSGMLLLAITHDGEFSRYMHPGFLLAEQRYHRGSGGAFQSRGLDKRMGAEYGTKQKG